MLNTIALQRFLREEFSAEAQSDFARLKRVPDTSVRHFLDYFRSLNEVDQDGLADAATQWGALKLIGSAATVEQYETLNANPAWARLRNERLMGRDRDPHWYYSVPLLRACVAQAKIDRAKGKLATVSKEMEDYAESIQSAKAPELRKTVRSVLLPLLGAAPSKLGTGNWECEGKIDGSRVVVNIDYGGRSAQLRYVVNFYSADPPVKLERIGFEIALGVGLGDWDFILAENASDSAKLLGEFVSYATELPRRLPQSCFE